MKSVTHLSVAAAATISHSSYQSPTHSTVVIMTDDFEQRRPISPWGAPQQWRHRAKMLANKSNNEIALSVRSV